MMNHLELQGMLKDLLSLEEGLTEWEVNFVDDMSSRQYFTLKMTNKIKELYNKHCLRRVTYD